MSLGLCQGILLAKVLTRLGPTIAMDMAKLSELVATDNFKASYPLILIPGKQMGFGTGTNHTLVDLLLNSGVLNTCMIHFRFSEQLHDPIALREFLKRLKQKQIITDCTKRC